MIDLGSLRFARPEAFLLVPLVLLLLRQRLLTGGRLVSTLRVLTLIVGASVLAEPVIVAGIVGRDLIVVVDRSRSAGDLPLGRLKEIYELAQQSAEEGDRIGLVSFGRDAAIEVAPTQGRAYAPPSRTLDREGTNLGSAVRVGLAAIPEGRPGALLIVSDGEATEGNAVAAAIEAKQRGVRIDTIPIRREGLMDLAVEDLIPPGEVAAGETFLIPAFITAVSSATADFRLVRDGEVIATGTETFTPGRNPIVLRDRIDRPGVHRYRLELINVQDRVPENNIAQAAVRATGPPRILCVTPSGREDRLSRSLELSGVEVVVARAEEADLSLDVLDGFRAVVLENVPASDLHSGALDALGTYVAKLGGALLMTGGKASFARGGYRNSRVEDVLPVTLEVRKEQRRFAVAMSLVLDRSGSMGASAGGSRTKMDLANLGSVAAIDLLSAMDSVSVIAVDSSPHIIVPQQQVTDPGTLKGKTRSITSGGGGIYTATGVHAAAKQLAKAVQGAKHIVVFADAADAEEPGNLHTFVPSLVKAGTTLSVIALGSASDVDAKFLRDLAKWGDGRCVFVSKASELPRIFAEETIKALKSSTIEEPTPVIVLPGLDELGAGIPRPFPVLGGYSIAYAKDEATLAARSGDGRDLPLLAFWQRGLGRSAAFMGEADGKLSGGLATWDGYGDLFATLGRWLAGAGTPRDLFARSRREGGEGVIEVVAVPGAEPLLARVRGALVDEHGEEAVHLERVGHDRLEGRFPLTAEKILRPVVTLGEEAAIPLAPLIRPLSEELKPTRDPGAGERTLRRLTQLTGGRFEPGEDALFWGTRLGRGGVELASWCALAALVLFLLEIAIRRLGFALPKSLGGFFAALTGSFRRRKQADAADQTVEKALTDKSLDEPGRLGIEGPTQAKKALREKGTMQDALSKARERSRRRS